MDLTGKRALVTGGGRGIGAAVAQTLAEHGAEVIICGRAWAQLDQVASAIGATAMVCDLRDRSATDQLVATLAAGGRIDILVNNAGIAESAPLADHDDAMWDRIMELDATAPFRLTRALVPPMAAAGWGRVITIASNAGLTGYGYSTAYCAAKHAVIGMTRALAVELGRTGVTINAVCPGWVDTDMAAEAATRIAGKTGRDLDAARAALTGMTPQRRLIAPAEVAHAVAMLCSDDARGIHGQALVVDGGQVLEVSGAKDGASRPTAVDVPGWPQPRGYSNGVIGAGRVLFVAGQIGWDADGRFASAELAVQFGQALANVLAVVAAAGGGPEHVASMTVFVTDMAAYRASLPAIGAAWRTHMSRVFPAMALVAVSALVEPQAVVEIQAQAILPA